MRDLRSPTGRVKDEILARLAEAFGEAGRNLRRARKTYYPIIFKERAWLNMAVWTKDKISFKIIL